MRNEGHLGHYVKNHWITVIESGEPVCERWKCLEKFARDTCHEKPPNVACTIIRLDRRKPWGPGNFKWKRKARTAIFEGEELTIAEIATKLGIGLKVLYYRLDHHPPHIAFSRESLNSGNGKARLNGKRRKAK